MNRVSRNMITVTLTALSLARLDKIAALRGRSRSGAIEAWIRGCPCPTCGKRECAHLPGAGS